MKKTTKEIKKEEALGRPDVRSYGNLQVTERSSLTFVHGRRRCPCP